MNVLARLFKGENKIQLKVDFVFSQNKSGGKEMWNNGN